MGELDLPALLGFSTRKSHLGGYMYPRAVLVVDFLAYILLDARRLRAFRSVVGQPSIDLNISMFAEPHLCFPYF